jgi:two-component system, OmpR family, response regulator
MTSVKKILIVDDDRTLSSMVKEYLEAKGFECNLYHNAFEALENFKPGIFTMCIFDVRMPLKDGFELSSDIKKLDSFIPFLFLTGQTEKEDRIRGLEAGADDYITKPFSMLELYLRIQAILRRAVTYQQPNGSQTTYHIGKFIYNSSTRELIFASKPTKLSALESKLLTLFCKAQDGVIHRDMALKLIWEDEYNFRERSLNVYVSKLRGYLQKDPDIEILNIHGVGYKMIFR